MGRKCKVIGENSSGTIRYGGVQEYSLPVSRLNLRLCHGQMCFDDFEIKENYGCKPDYCCINEDLIKTLEYIVVDEDLIDGLVDLWLR